MTRPGTSLTERMDGLLFFPVTPFGADGRGQVRLTVTRGRKTEATVYSCTAFPAYDGAAVQL